MLLAGCSVPPPNNQQAQQHDITAQHAFALAQQQAPPRKIQSIALYPAHHPDAPPVITLHSDQKLVLSFDLLKDKTEQFRVEVSHRDKNWEESAIGPSTYLDSFSHTYIQRSNKSLGQRPSYQHYEYAFPNNQLRPAVSGNYLLEIYGYQSNEMLFSMPFLVSENQGELQTKIESLFAKREDGRPLAQPFSQYRYPKFVEFPQFDLSIAYMQNRFWGRIKRSGYLDTSTPGELNGHLDRNNAFIANYEYKRLNLRTFDVDGQHIVAYHPGRIPPEIMLKRDVQNLSENPSMASDLNSGLPRTGTNGSYADVIFSLETAGDISPSSGIYIAGDFNNWMIHDLNKMEYHADEKIWRGRAFVKQGRYRYKYVIAGKNGIHDLALDQGFLSSSQEYVTLIYFEDPSQHYDRLLKVDRLQKR